MLGYIITSTVSEFLCLNINLRREIAYLEALEILEYVVSQGKEEAT